MSKKKKYERVLGFDFGTVSIGVAIGNIISRTAEPLAAIKSIDGIPNKEQLEKVIKEWEPDCFVVGLPLNMDGSYQDVTYKAKKFGNRLSANYNKRVFFKDERLSTKYARDYIFSNKGYKGLTKGVVDSQSAVVILEGFFEEYAEELIKNL
ncbi:MAG: Holliday junction resolvase RuvX [Succinivibrionaceae bacterium]